jgi:hypothetical protein
MKTATLCFAFLALSTFGAGFAAAQAVPAPPPPPSAPAPGPAPGDSAATATGAEPTESWQAETELEDQTELAVTVYNSNVALVRDRRKVTLPTGEFRLRFGGVAQQIRPETVSLQSVATPGSLHVLEQNYEYDLISPSKLMEKYVGKKVKLVNFDQDIRTGEVEAELLSVNEQPVYRVGGEIYLGYPGQVVLPEIPENLVAKPSLVWLLVNQLAEQTVEATYLTNGLRWNADYVASYDEKADKMSLEGWVTLVNESGATYNNATLKLVAGDVNIVQPPQPMPMEMMAYDTSTARPAAVPPQMVEEAFGEYHLYTLQRPATIRQNQTKQVSLLSAADVGVEKTYELKGNTAYYIQIFPPMKDQKVEVRLKFKNSEANNLGMPLPAGTVRVYEKDQSGTLQFSGEDRIEHTPKDEEVEVKLGNAFDVVAERTQTDHRVIGQNVFQSAFEVVIRNHKDEAITVKVSEPMTGDWQILESSIPFEKEDAFTAVFSVPVPADGEAKVTYRVQVRM